MRIPQRFLFLSLVGLTLLQVPAFAACQNSLEINDPAVRPAGLPAIQCSDIPQNDLHVGDLIFAHVDNFLYSRVAVASGGWTSHVGMIDKDDQGNWVVHESRPVYSVTTPLCDFIKRNSRTRVALTRLRDFTLDEEKLLHDAAMKRMHIRYDMWFELNSKNSTFCSKYIDQVYFEALGQHVGKVQSFRDLLSNLNGRPDTKSELRFWKSWFLGRIPWEQTTVTPQSQLDDPNFKVWYDSNTSVEDPAAPPAAPTTP